MLSHLDHILFPDRCEVIEVVPSQRYVYVIFKNGHSSLKEAGRNNRWPVLINEQITKIKHIDIIVRDPQERLISGINTFIQHTLRDNPTLDPKTVRWFALKYLSLDRHYVSQFAWLVNLARYLAPECVLTFYPMKEIDVIAGVNMKPYGVSEATTDLIQQILSNNDQEMYQRVDQQIVRCIGQSLTWKQLLNHLQLSDRLAFEFVVGHSKKVLNPVHALP